MKMDGFMRPFSLFQILMGLSCDIPPKIGVYISIVIWNKLFHEVIHLSFKGDISINIVLKSETGFFIKPSNLLQIFVVFHRMSHWILWLGCLYSKQWYFITYDIIFALYHMLAGK